MSQPPVQPVDGDDDPSAVEGLPPAFRDVLTDYRRHLESERDLSAHSVRAYLTDLTSMLEHARRLGHDDLATLELRTLRSWLAQQQSLGRSRTTVARRATAARVFTAWLARTGRVPADPGASLASPKAHRVLPPVLRRDEAESLVRAAADHADDGSPMGLRDVAVLVLGMYQVVAKQIKVSPLFFLPSFSLFAKQTHGLPRPCHS